jgi:hypothetical protein
MRSDVGRIGHGRLVVSVDGKYLQNVVEDLARVPARELGVDRLPRTEALGQVAPRSAGLGEIENRVHEQSVGQLGGPRSSPAFRREQRFNTRPFFVAQLVTSHVQR